METKTFYLDTGNDRLYFNIIGDVITCNSHVSHVPLDKLITFLHTARELGLKAGEL